MTSFCKFALVVLKDAPKSLKYIDIDGKDVASFQDSYATILSDRSINLELIKKAQFLLNEHHMKFHITQRGGKFSFYAPELPVPECHFNVICVPHNINPDVWFAETGRYIGIRHRHNLNPQNLGVSVLVGSKSKHTKLLPLKAH